MRNRRGWRAWLPPALYIALRWLWVPLRRLVLRAVNAAYMRRPVQRNKIVFDNYTLRDYGCNPKYVAQKLIERGADGLDLVWIIAREDVARNEVPPQIRCVPSGSLASFREYATAKLWVSNFHKISLVKCGLTKREGQRFIQMWHGSLGIKRIDGDVPALRRLRGWLPAAVRSSEMVDYWISNSDFETNVYKSAFWGVRDGAILRYGHPRNDIFFDAAAMERARRKVDERYALRGRRILLYAPTFRERLRMDGGIDRRTSDFGLNFAELLAHVRRRFGGAWAILVRQHPRLNELELAPAPDAADVIDATRYADMQELLAASDCLLTDYSSCAFDFMLTRRPVFLLAGDARAYGAERGFYYPLEETPFPLARDCEALMRNIDAFDPAGYPERIEAFLRGKGCVEDGGASERVARLVEDLISRGDGGE